MAVRKASPAIRSIIKHGPNMKPPEVISRATTKEGRAIEEAVRYLLKLTDWAYGDRGARERAERASARRRNREKARKGESESDSL